MNDLVAFCGRMGSGKTTAAKFLVDHYGFTRTRFADPLKNMLRELMRSAGYVDHEIDAYLDGDRKETPLEVFGGRSMRHAMQTLGTEWGRDLIYPNLWASLWRRKAEGLLESGGKVVIDDLRFPSEVDVVRSLGGVIVRVVTEDAPLSTHSSENFGLDADVQVFNPKAGLPEFIDLIERALKLGACN